MAPNSKALAEQHRYGRATVTAMATAAVTAAMMRAVSGGSLETCGLVLVQDGVPTMPMCTASQEARCPADRSRPDHPKVAGVERHGECPLTTGTDVCTDVRADESAAGTDAVPSQSWVEDVSVEW